VPSLAIPKTCTYYSATASDFLLASPPLLAVEEKSNEGIISVWRGFTCRKPVAARDFAGLMARVRAGAEVVIENGTCPWL
jgi:hypothetical protein